MRFVKRLIILSGEGGKGTLGIEKNAYGTNVKLSLYGPQLLDGFLVLRIDGKFFSRALGGGRGSFAVEGVESLDLVHAAVFGRGELAMYGTNDPQRLSHEGAVSFKKHIGRAASPHLGKTDFGNADSRAANFGNADLRKAELGMGRGLQEEQLFLHGDYPGDTLLVDGYSSVNRNPRWEKSEYHDEQLAEENYYSGAGSYSHYAESAATTPPPHIAPRAGGFVDGDFDEDADGDFDEDIDDDLDDALDEDIDEDLDEDLDEDINIDEDLEEDLDEDIDIDEDLDEDLDEDMDEGIEDDKDIDKEKRLEKGFKNEEYIKRVIPSRPKIITPMQNAEKRAEEGQLPSDMAYRFVMSKVGVLRFGQGAEAENAERSRAGEGIHSRGGIYYGGTEDKRGGDKKTGTESESGEEINRRSISRKDIDKDTNYNSNTNGVAGRGELRQSLKHNDTSRDTGREEKRSLRPAKADGQTGQTAYNDEKAFGTENATQNGGKNPIVVDEFGRGGEFGNKSEFTRGGAGGRAFGRERISETKSEERTKILTKDPHVKARQGTFFEQNGEEIERLFSGNREKELEQVLPGSKWVRIDYDVNRYYVIGLIGREFLCYGVPSSFTPVPPEELKGYCWWLPIKPDQPQGKGYWVMYQSLETGESVLPVGENGEE